MVACTKVEKPDSTDLRKGNQNVIFGKFRSRFFVIINIIIKIATLVLGQMNFTLIFISGFSG